MKNFIQNLVPSKLSYKLVCLFIIAMFAGNAQASTIYFAGPPSNNLGGAIVDQFPNETIILAIQGPLFLQSNAVNNLTGSPYTISTASGTTFNNTTDIGTAALFFAYRRRLDYRVYHSNGGSYYCPNTNCSTCYATVCFSCRGQPFQGDISFL